MKKILVIALVALAVAGCTRTQQGASIGAASGAVIGGLASGTTEGALIGAAIGGAAGAVIGRVSENSQDCYYRDLAHLTYDERTQAYVAYEKALLAQRDDDQLAPGQRAPRRTRR